MRIGLTIPGIVAAVLEIPISTLAYCGAMSSGLTLLNKYKQKLIRLQYKVNNSATYNGAKPNILITP